MLRSVFILATHRYASQKHDNYLDPRQYYSLGYCYMLWFYSCNWYASQIHDNCLSYIFLLLIVVRIIWKSGNNYIDDHTKYEAKSARDGAWYGDSCTWPSFCFLIDCQILQGFQFLKKWRGTWLYIYTRLPYCASNFWTDYSYINFLSPYILPCIFSYALINKSNKVLIDIVFFIMYLCAKQYKLSLLAYHCIRGSLFSYMSQIK